MRGKACFDKRWQNYFVLVRGRSVLKMPAMAAKPEETPSARVGPCPFVRVGHADPETL
jgi:hypothetical protein